VTFRIAYSVVLLAGLFASDVLRASDDEYSRSLLTLINEYRTARGRPALAFDSTIAALAIEHSSAMAKAGKLSHDGFPSRVERSHAGMCIENVGWNYRTPKAQFDAWRASPGHDRNMLDARVDRIGIGTAAAYVTMMACGQ
jgi:uncharacterized protein YkwD